MKISKSKGEKMTRDHVVKMKNLRNVTDSKTKACVSNLFNKFLNISLSEDDVDLGQDRQHQYAIIYLRSHDEVEMTLDRLSSSTGRSSLGYKFNNLVGPKQELEVERFKFYRVGEKLGIKDKTTEFRKGFGDYFDRQFKLDVVKFICGFINCTGKGILYVGVSHKGHVLGLNFEHWKVNRVQSTTDFVFGTVSPVIHSDCFSVEFVPVYTSDGYPIAGNKVLEITVNNGKPKFLYSVCEEVYVRRQTSVYGPLTVSQVLSLTQEIHRKELERERRKIVDERQKILKESQMEYELLLNQKEKELEGKMEKNLEKERRRTQKEKEEEINRLQQIVSKFIEVKQESKFCTIM